MQHPHQQPASPNVNTMTAMQILDAAVAQMSKDHPAANLTDAFAKAVAALKAPNGYIVKVANAALRHDLCRATPALAHAAAIDAKLTAGNFSIEPFVVLRR